MFPVFGPSFSPGHFPATNGAGLAGQALLVVAACDLSKNQDRSLDAGVRLEDAAGKGYHAFYDMLNQQFPAQTYVGIGVAEQNPFRNDHRTAPANIEQVEHQPQEEQLAFVGDRFILFLAATATTLLLFSL